MVARIVTLTVFALLSGCASVPEPNCAAHHCDPSFDEQFKRNASWDARTPGEYLKVQAKN